VARSHSSLPTSVNGAEYSIPLELHMAVAVHAAAGNGFQITPYGEAAQHRFLCRPVLETYRKLFSFDDPRPTCESGSSE